MTDRQGPAGMLIVTFEGYKYVLAYLVLVAAVVAAFLVVENQQDTISKLQKENEAAIQNIEEVRAAARERFSGTDRSICEANNRQDRVLRGLVVVAIRSSADAEQTPARVELRERFTAALDELQGQDCKKLPSQNVP